MNNMRRLCVLDLQATSMRFRRAGGMTKEITIVFPHTLGQEEARLRVVDALERVRTNFAQSVVTSGVTWTDHHADVVVGALGQDVQAQIDVEPDKVRVSVTLPWLFERLSGRIIDKITQVGRGTLQIGSGGRG